LAGLISVPHSDTLDQNQKRTRDTQWPVIAVCQYTISKFLNLLPNLHILQLASCLPSSHFPHRCSARLIFKYLHQLLEFLTPNLVSKCLISASPILQLTDVHQGVGYTRRWFVLSCSPFPLWVRGFKNYCAPAG